MGRAGAAVCDRPGRASKATRSWEMGPARPIHTVTFARPVHAGTRNSLPALSTPSTPLAPTACPPPPPPQSHCPSPTAECVHAAGRRTCGRRRAPTWEVGAHGRVARAAARPRGRQPLQRGCEVEVVVQRARVALLGRALAARQDPVPHVAGLLTEAHLHSERARTHTHARARLESRGCRRKGGPWELPLGFCRGGNRLERLHQHAMLAMQGRAWHPPGWRNVWRARRGGAGCSSEGTDGFGITCTWVKW